MIQVLNQINKKRPTVRVGEAGVHGGVGGVGAGGAGSGVADPAGHWEPAGHSAPVPVWLPPTVGVAMSMPVDGRKV